MVEAVVRGRANGQIIEPLQKALLIEEECLLSADLEVVVSRDIGWKFHPQASPGFAVLLVWLDFLQLETGPGEKKARSRRSLIFSLLRGEIRSRT